MKLNKITVSNYRNIYKCRKLSLLLILSLLFAAIPTNVLAQYSYGLDEISMNHYELEEEYEPETNTYVEAYINADIDMEAYTDVDIDTDYSVSGINLIIHPPQPSMRNFQPVHLAELDTQFTDPHNGEVLPFAPMAFVTNIENHRYVTAYVSLEVIARIAGLQYDWNPIEGYATLTDGFSTVIVRDGQEFAIVNGQTVQIVAGNLRADSRLIDGTFYVPVYFIQELSPFGVTIWWNPSGRRNRSITVFPLNRGIIITLD